MKLSVRFLALFFSLAFLFSTVAQAEDLNPLKEYSMDQIIAMKLAIEAEIATREGDFKTVTVPIGRYWVGMDIPVGVYTLTGAEGGWLSSVVRILDENGDKIFWDQISAGEKIGRLELLYGYQVEIETEAVIFSTYKGLGF